MNPLPQPEQEDDGLDWLRDIRRNIAAKFANNPHRLGDH